MQDVKHAGTIYFNDLVKCYYWYCCQHIVHTYNPFQTVILLKWFGSGVYSVFVKQCYNSLLTFVMCSCTDTAFIHHLLLTYILLYQ